MSEHKSDEPEECRCQSCQDRKQEPEQPRKPEQKGLSKVDLIGYLIAILILLFVGGVAIVSNNPWGVALDTLAMIVLIVVSVRDILEKL